ncbi:hypothetical protein E3N88_21545 [Mikania micrantha]|uniref:Uncharacterized protein n=1 Tax=Mikania micrantha TaxID=192012 RepID=A0A5N6NK83_9ASTR|nr:hypothetical protein E3N88_21545 [Mikania micrantha]
MTMFNNYQRMGYKKLKMGYMSSMFGKEACKEHEWYLVQVRNKDSGNKMDDHTKRKIEDAEGRATPQRSSMMHHNKTKPSMHKENKCVGMTGWVKQHNHHKRWRGNGDMHNWNYEVWNPKIVTTEKVVHETCRGWDGVHGIHFQKRRNYGMVRNVPDGGDIVYNIFEVKSEGGKLVGKHVTHYKLMLKLKEDNGKLYSSETQWGRDGWNRSIMGRSIGKVGWGVVHHSHEAPPSREWKDII